MSMVGEPMGIPGGKAGGGEIRAGRPVKKPVARPRGGLVAAVDIGSGKVCCFVARVGDRGPQVIGIGHQLSRGVRNGVIVDLDAASQSVVNAVHAAEQMAVETVSEVVVNLSGGFPASHIVPVEIPVSGHEIGEQDMRRVLEEGHRLRVPEERAVIHSIPVGFSIDGSRGIKDPRGMAGRRLGVNMHIVSAKPAILRNINAAIGRCHLDVAAVVVSPYASGLACLVEDEMELGVTLVDMGAGTTTIAVFFDNSLIFADTVPVGGAHVTSDIARGLSTPLVQAERMKTLHGSALPSPADERESITVPQVGEEEGQANHVPKSLLVGIISPRLEETLELVRNRLEASGYERLAGRRVVLTGGACQLPGTRELAGLILDKQIRIGRPLNVTGLGEATQGPAFSTCAGLLHFALSERAETPRPARLSAGQPNGLLGRIGLWLRENF